MYLPYQYVLEERSCLYLEVDNEGRFLLCFNRHKPEIGAKALEETNTIRPLLKGPGLTKGIFLHRVQDIRKCLDETLGYLISVNICICFSMEEKAGKEKSLLDDVQAWITIPRSPVELVKICIQEMKKIVWGKPIFDHI